jgi:hypothetical protein
MSYQLPPGILPVRPSDAARRMNTTMSLHQIGAQWNRWVVFSYEDGSSDGITYTTRQEAINFKSPFEQNYFYLQVNRDGFNEDIAERLLRVHRKVKESGMQMVDPDTNAEPIIPDRLDDLLRIINA